MKCHYLAIWLVRMPVLCSAKYSRLKIPDQFSSQQNGGRTWAGKETSEWCGPQKWQHIWEQNGSKCDTAFHLTVSCKWWLQGPTVGQQEGQCMANKTTLLSGKAINVSLLYMFMLHTANHAYLHTLWSVSEWLQGGGRGVGRRQRSHKLTFVQSNKYCIFTL